MFLFHYKVVVQNGEKLICFLNISYTATFTAAVVPLLNSSDARGIVAESLLNFPYGFHLGVAKLLAKFYVIPLLMSIRHFMANANAMDIHYNDSLTG